MSDKGKNQVGNIIFGCAELRYLVQHLYGSSCSARRMKESGKNIKNNIVEGKYYSVDKILK